jgi:aminopeptidase N
MKIAYYITALCLLSICKSFAQETDRRAELYAAEKKPVQTASKTTLATPEEGYYDVKYLKFDLNLSNTSVTVQGDVTIKALTTVSSFNVFAFELDSLLTIDSVKLNNQLLTVQSSNNYIRKVNLPSPLSNGIMFTAQVFYHGTPVAGNGTFFSHGINHVTLPSTTEIVYTLSDMYLAKDWWPCKQSILDKIDSVDMWVTIPSGLKAASNGLLKNVTSLPGSKNRYEWKTSYPIDYYLIKVAVAPYSERSFYMHFTDGSGDSMLIQNYMYDSSTYMTPANASALDSTGLILDYLSKIYGKYPFYKEKYGHCIAEPLGGGMEDQTMTTLADAKTWLIAHEMGHQWWGDNVTYGSWRDIWLSEGFASYTEQLFVEHFWGDTAFKNYRVNVFNGALANSGSVYVDDTTDVNRVFSSSLTYKKGASVAHMLRYLAPQDSLFFRVLKNYQQQFAFSNAITSDLQTIAQQVYGISLDTFFKQWVYGEGYPTYTAKWYQLGTQVYLQINQTTSKPSSVAVFKMPLELTIKSATGDSTVKVYNDQASQTFPFYFNKTMTGLSIDPNRNILCKVVNSNIKQDATILNVNTINADDISVYPNPAKDAWQIKNLPVNASLSLTDAAGKLIWHCNSSFEASIPAAQLAQGTYILSVSATGMALVHYKLMK